MIIAIAILNCYSIPFVLSFQPPWAETKAWKMANWVITAIFASDLIVNLRTTYIDGVEGEEVFDGKLLARNYLRSNRFIVDLLSTVPLEVVFEGIVSSSVLSIMSGLGMLKLVRASRISTIIARLKSGRSVKALYQLLQMIFFLILFVHIQGCLVYFFVRTSSPELLLLGAAGVKMDPHVRPAL